MCRYLPKELARLLAIFLSHVRPVEGAITRALHGGAAENIALTFLFVQHGVKMSEEAIRTSFTSAFRRTKGLNVLFSEYRWVFACLLACLLVCLFVCLYTGSSPFLAFHASQTRGDCLHEAPLSERNTIFTTSPAHRRPGVALCPDWANGVWPRTRRSTPNHRRARAGLLDRVHSMAAAARDQFGCCAGWQLGEAPFDYHIDPDYHVDN